MSDTSNAEWVEDLTLLWDTQQVSDAISVSLTSSEYDALRQIGTVAHGEAVSEGEAVS